MKKSNSKDAIQFKDKNGNNIKIGPEGSLAALAFGDITFMLWRNEKKKLVDQFKKAQIDKHG